MRAIVNRIAAALSMSAIAVLPLAAQNTAAQCDPTANTKGDIAKAQFSMTRAIAAIDKGNPTRDLQDVLRLVDNGNDNPTARNYLRGEAYIIYLMIKAANKAMRKGPDAPAGPSEVELLTEIRDELRKRA